MSEEESNNYWRKVSDEEIILGMEIAGLKKSELQRKYVDDVLELKAEIDVQNEQIIALETVLEEKEKVITIDKAMFEDSISKGQVAKNYIEKAKIEDKIKEIEEKYNYKFKTGELQQALIYQYQMKLLQELLEEE